MKMWIWKESSEYYHQINQYPSYDGMNEVQQTSMYSRLTSSFRRMPAYSPRS